MTSDERGSSWNGSAVCGVAAGVAVQRPEPPKFIGELAELVSLFVRDSGDVLWSKHQAKVAKAYAHQIFEWLRSGEAAKDSTQTRDEARADSVCGSTGMVQPGCSRNGNKPDAETGHAVTTTEGGVDALNDSQGEVVPALAPDQRRERAAPFWATVAYVWDRREQYKPSSGTYEGLSQVIAGLCRGAHIEAWEHGELDDLRKDVERCIRESAPSSRTGEKP